MMPASKLSMISKFRRAWRLVATTITPVAGRFTGLRGYPAQLPVRQPPEGAGSAAPSQVLNSSGSTASQISAPSTPPIMGNTMNAQSC